MFEKGDVRRTKDGWKVFDGKEWRDLVWSMSTSAKPVEPQSESFKVY